MDDNDGVFASICSIGAKIRIRTDSEIGWKSEIELQMNSEGKWFHGVDSKPKKIYGKLLKARRK